LVVTERVATIGQLLAALEQLALGSVDPTMVLATGAAECWERTNA